MSDKKSRTHAERRKDLLEKHRKKQEDAAPGHRSESEMMDDLVRRSIRDHGA
jgi:hypothetical protein